MTFARQPRWSANTTLLFAVACAALVAALVLLLVRRSIWEELELIVAALALCAWGFLFFVLYNGVRFERNRWTTRWVRLDVVGEHVPTVDSFGVFTEAGAEHGPAGIVVGFLLDVVVTIVLVALIVALVWVGINAALAAVLILWMPLVYLFRRSLRYIVTRGRTCRRHAGRAAAWAAVYAAGNAAWLYAILALGRWLALRGAGAA